MTELLHTAQLGWVDVVLIVVMLWALIVGYRGGLSKEFQKFASVLSGVFLTFHYVDPVSTWIKRNSFIPGDIAGPLSFVALLVISVVITFYVLQVLGKMFEVKVFPLLEKVGGMILAAVRYALTLGLLTHFLFFLPIPYIEQAYNAQSVTGRYLISVCSNTYRGMNQFIHLPEWRMEPQVTAK